MVFLKNKSGFAPAGRLAVRNLVIFFATLLFFGVM